MNGDDDPGQLTPSGGVEDDGGLPGLAEKLDHLFAVVPKPTGGRYSNETAAAALADELGVRVSAVHLSHLRTGRRNNPSARLLGALAQFFGVEIGYFFDPAIERKANADLVALQKLAAAGGQGALSRGVSARNLKHLDAILNALRDEAKREVERDLQGRDEPEGER